MGENGKIQSPILGKVLVAEDDISAQKAIVELLFTLGFSVQVVTSGTLAVQLVLLEVDDYSLILMDCDIPDLDGFSAARLIRESEQGKADHIPIIGLIETSSRGSVEDCFASGMDDCIPKPAPVEELRRVMQQWARPVMKPENSSCFPPASEPDGPPLVFEILEGIRELQPENEPDVLTELIGIYLRSSEILILQIRSAWNDRNYLDIRKCVHNLKGSSGTLGAQRLSSFCNEILQQMDQQVSVDSMADWLPRLEAEHARVYKALLAEQKK